MPRCYHCKVLPAGTPGYYEFSAYCSLCQPFYSRPSDGVQGVRKSEAVRVWGQFSEARVRLLSAVQNHSREGVE